MAYRKILLVEDEPTRKIVLEDAVKQIDPIADRYIVDNLEEAKDYLSGNRVDLVILGWDFPTSKQDRIVEQNGPKLLDYIEKQQRGIKTIVCSSCATELLRGERTGVPMVMPTPFDGLADRLRIFM